MVVVSHWFALSDEPEIAYVNEKNQSWWYKPGRDDPKLGDKVIVYQPGTTKNAKNKIDEDYQCRFIGNFTVEDIDPAEWAIRIKEKSIIWDKSRFVDIYSLLNYLECTQDAIKKYGRKYWGLMFKNKVWIPITHPDYEVILSKKK